MPFTQSAHQLLAQARDEAQRLRHEYVGTEHLVLALTSQAENVAVRALLNQQIDLQRVRETVASIVSPGRAVVSADSALPYTTRTKQVLALAEESARELGRSDVGTEHILIGILREAMGIGGQALVHHGASVDAIIDEVRRMSDGG